MVATWLTELYLDQINRALLEEAGEDAGEGQQGVEKLVQQLRAFLRSQCDSLDPAVTVTLLASYGRLDDLMHYAQYRQVHHLILSFLVLPVLLSLMCLVFVGISSGCCCWSGYSYGIVVAVVVNTVIHNITNMYADILYHSCC
jgi:hypothetical protein